MSDRFDEWIDRVIKRADELRAKGVLSIGVDGCAATFAPAEATPMEEPNANDADPVWHEPTNAWEDPASYPSGIVPSLEIDELPIEERR